MECISKIKGFYIEIIIFSSPNLFLLNFVLFCIHFLQFSRAVV